MMDNVEVKTKRCSKCGRILPITEFHKNKSRKDGLQYYCKQCSSAREKNYYANNKEAIAQKHAAYNAAHKEAIAQKNDEYRQANKEAIAQRNAKWYSNNKEAIAQKHAAYNAIYYDPQKNPLGWIKSIVRGYRKMDRERGFDDSQTITADWFLDNIAYKPCKYCGKQGIGLVGVNRKSNALGHISSNCEPCCPSCNSRENVRDMLERGSHVSFKGKARNKTA